MGISPERMRKLKQLEKNEPHIKCPSCGKKVRNNKGYYSGHGVGVTQCKSAHTKIRK